MNYLLCCTFKSVITELFENFSKNFRSSRKLAFVYSVHLFLLTSPLIVSAQKYEVGVAMCDTICSDNFYISDGPGCSLSFRLNSTLNPYVTGLTFQIQITTIEGVVLSNLGDTVKVGDIFSLPPPNESGVLKISFTEMGDSFTYLAKLVGTPEIEGERYYCNLGCATTLALCNNGMSFWPENDSMCSVTSFPSSIDYSQQSPTVYQLKVNYPNPFNPSTAILYSILIPDFVNLTVYNLFGREIQSLVNEFQQPGSYSVQFDASEHASGIYFYRIIVGKNFSKTKKMLLLR